MYREILQPLGNDISPHFLPIYNEATMLRMASHVPRPCSFVVSPVDLFCCQSKSPNPSEQGLGRLHVCMPAGYAGDINVTEMFEDLKLDDKMLL